MSTRTHIPQPSRPTPPAPVGAKAPSIKPARPSDDQIRELAYMKFLSRAGKPGDPCDDWYAAEQELCRRLSAGGRSQ